MALLQVFLGRFWDPMRVSRISNRVPRIREGYHWVTKIRENRVPTDHTGCLTFSLKKTWITVVTMTLFGLHYAFFN